MTDATPAPQWSVTDPESFRRELQAWLAEHWHTAQTVREWWAALATAGLTAPTWSKVRGGLSATAASQDIIEAELARAGAIAPPVDGAGLRIVAPVLREHGTPAQADRLLGPILRGEHGWCLLIDEADVDDVTDSRCRIDVAERAVHVDGRKLLRFSRRADYALLVGRSDAAVTGQRGLTCVIVDMGGEGVTPIDDRRAVVRTSVDPSAVVGQVGEGIVIARAVQAYVERSLAGRIRRRLVNVEPGTRAGQLDRTISAVLERSVPPWPPPFERRRRTD